MTDFEKSLREQLGKLDADYGRNRRILLDAIARAAGRHMPTSKPGGDDDSVVASCPPPHPKQLEAVKAAIVALDHLKPEGFTKNDVRMKLKEMQLDVSENVIKNMSSFLWRLHKYEGFITVKMQGQGRQQSIYAKL